MLLEQLSHLTFCIIYKNKPRLVMRNYKEKYIILSSSTSQSTQVPKVLEDVVVFFQCHKSFHNR